MLYGLTAWGIPSLMAVTCGDIVGPVMAPAAYGFLTVFHGLGQAVGPYVAGRMADALPSFTASYLVAAGVACLGAIGMILLPARATSHLGGMPCAEPLAWRPSRTVPAPLHRRRGARSEPGRAVAAPVARPTRSLEHPLYHST